MGRSSYPNGFPGGMEIKGIPLVTMGGTNYFVDPVNGSDGNNGKTWQRAVKTLAKAHSLQTTGANDTTYLIGNGATSGTARETETLTWSKNAAHLVGVAAPTAVAARARYSAASGSTYATMMTVSGDGNIIANLHVFQNYATDAANICMNVTGERNYFYGGHYAGGGHATGAGNAGMTSLTLTGDGENTFDGVTIGLDTIARTAASGEIDFKSAAVRNVFRDCNIVTFGAAGTFFVTADSSGCLDRYTIFDNCNFLNAPTGAVGGAATMTAGFSVHASAGGYILVKDCSSVGMTGWTAADNSLVYLMCHGIAGSGNLNTGIAHTVDIA
jgi:hypothetical protein